MTLDTPADDRGRQVSRTRAWAVSAVVLALTSGLAGCGSDTERYCEQVAAEKDTLASLAERSEASEPEVLGETLAVFEKLRERAPGDISDEWDTLVFALQGLVETLDEVGVDAGEYDPAKPPAGLDDAEEKALRSAAAELASARVQDASVGIEQHARDVCDVDFGLTR